MIDSHAHLTHPDYAPEGPRALLDRAAAAGVERVVCVAYDIPSCAEVARLARAEASVSAVVGIHPHESDRARAEDLARVEELGRLPEVVAIGETGLDFYRDWADRANQERLFHEQISLAARLAKPIVIHSRDAAERLIAVLEEHEGELTGGVFHCFSGDRAFLDRALALGFSISIPGTVTFSKKNGKLAEAVRACPADRLLVETDCPWLAPAPHRGRRNEPSYLPLVLEEIASLRGIAREEADRITTENTRRLFRLEG